MLFFVGIPHISEVAGLYQPGTTQVTIVNLDNEAENEKYGDMPIVDTRWSSVSEQVADFVTLLEPQVEIDRDIAQNLLDGISFATQDFRSPRTSFLAFEVAGILMKKGAVRPQVAAQQAQDTSSFFPSVKPQPVMQQQEPVVSQPIMQAPVSQQPIAPVQPAPVLPAQPAQAQPEQSQQAPADWLTPKVYKGSSIL